MKFSLREVSRYIVPVLILIGGIAGMILLRASRKPPETNETTSLAPLVETLPVTACTDGFRLRVDGQVNSIRQITLSAEIRGRIAKKYDHSLAGSFVKKGDLLFEIDPRDYDLEVRRLQAAVKQSAVSIEEADIEKSNTERLITLAQNEIKIQDRDVARLRDLRRRQAASESQLEAAQREEIRLLNSLQTLQNQVRLVEAKRNRIVRDRERAIAELDKATLDLSRTKITSPIDAIVINDFVEQDDFVQPGTQLVQLEDTAQVEINFNLRMKQLRWLWSGEVGSADSRRSSFRLPPVEVLVFLDLDGRRFQWTGVLARYDGAGISPATRTIPCIAIVDEPWNGRLADGEPDADFTAPPTLMRGMFVSIEIPIPGREDLIQIPSVALRPRGEVWAVRNGLLIVEKVRVAYQDQTGPVVLMGNSSGIDINDEVITTPLPQPTRFMPVRRANDETLTSSPNPKEAI